MIDTRMDASERLRRGLAATTNAWRLFCTVHNLLEIHRHRVATT